ncbi:MAG: hypothetical protein WCJ64_23600 [Rhodospirillaceae bacterium]
MKKLSSATTVSVGGEPATVSYIVAATTANPTKPDIFRIEKGRF